MTTILAIVGTVCLMGMMLIVMTNIVTRVFGKAILGTYEAVELLIVVMVIFSIGYSAIQKDHVVVSVIISQLSKSVQRILYIFTTFLSLGIWGLIAWYSYKFARDMQLVNERTAIMEWPVYHFRYIFAFGTIILCLVLFLDIFKALRESIKK